jgi:D-alanine--poly(phosphoribitol) ligase subunit 1
VRASIVEYFETGAAIHYPDKIGLADEQGAYTFAQWGAFAKQCAAMILARHDVLNQPIAVFLPKNAKALIADLGVLYSGNCYNNLDVKSPLHRTKSILDNVNPPLVITAAEYAGSLAEMGIGADRLLLIDDVLGHEPDYDNQRILDRLRRVIDTDPVCIINTSGSTGIPKSVVLNHRGLLDFFDWYCERFTFDQNDVVGSLSPFYFDGYLVGLFMSWLRGAKLEIVPEQLAMFPVKLAGFLAERGITFIFWVPTVMVNMASMDALRDAALPRLRMVCFAGEVFPSKHLNYWRKHVPQATFINLYGPIEISVICTYYVVDREFGDDEPLPIGVPCRNTDIMLLDELDELCGPAETGELCVRGSSLAHGYWNDPEKTAAAFVQNPLNKAYPELIYRTGDLAYWNDRGELMFVGRKDFQIKHSGFRIELGEIEHAATGIEAISNACVLYDKPAMEIILLYEAQEELSAEFLRRSLLSRLPKYMLPRRFIRIAEMPRNPNGKIDRQRLMATFLEAKS